MNKEVVELLSSEDHLEPETLNQMFPNLTNIEKQKIQVLRVLLTSNVILNDMDVFENAVQVLNGIDPDIEKTEGCKPEWIEYALLVIQGLLKENFAISAEVEKYIKWVYKNDGIKFLPSVFEKNPVLDEVMKIAKDGPFPLINDSSINIQVMKYLKIQQYIKELFK